MSSPKGAAVADAMLAQMKAAASSTWAEAFDTTREYLDRPLAETVKKVKVSAQLEHTDIVKHGRATLLYTHRIRLGIRKNVSPDLVGAVDPVVLLVEQVAKFWLAGATGGNRAITNTNAKAISAMVDTLISPSELDERRQAYGSVIVIAEEIVKLL